MTTSSSSQQTTGAVLLIPTTSALMQEHSPAPLSSPSGMYSFNPRSHERHDSIQRTFSPLSSRLPRQACCLRFSLLTYLSATQRSRNVKLTLTPDESLFHPSYKLWNKDSPTEPSLALYGPSIILFTHESISQRLSDV